MATLHSFGPRGLSDSGLGSLGSESDSSPIGVLYDLTSGGGAANDGMTLLTGDCSGSKPRSNRKFRLVYFGESILDKWFTKSKLPWIMADLRHKKNRKCVELEILDECLQAKHTSVVDNIQEKEIVFEHNLQNLSRFARVHHDPTCFSYLIKSDPEAPFICHVFQTAEESQVPEIFSAIKDATLDAVKDHNQNPTVEKDKLDQMPEDNKASPPTLCEVLYVGKVIVGNKKTPPTFIDEAVEKFKMREERKKKEMEEDKKRHASGSSVKSLPACLEQVTIKENQLGRKPSMEVDQSYLEMEQNDFSTDTLGSGEYAAFSSNDNITIKENSRERRDSECSLEDAINHQIFQLSRSGSIDNDEERRDSSEALHKAVLVNQSVQAASKNRTMLIQVGMRNLALISPDRKSVILERKFKDISFCSQGIQQPEHFGFISREPTTGNFVCYVFKCAAEPVVEEIMQTLKQAFHAAFQQTTKNHTVCELCPMHQLNKLCNQVEGFPPLKCFEILQRKLEILNEKEHEEIMGKFREENPQTYQEMNEILMRLLRQMCEEKQKEHTHISDSNRIAARNEFNLMDSSRAKFSSKFDIFKSKAKKSLASSFESLRGKNKRDEAREAFRERSWTTDSDGSFSRSYDSSTNNTPDVTPCSSPRLKNFPEGILSPTEETQNSKFGRPRSSTVGAVPEAALLQDRRSPKPHEKNKQKPPSVRKNATWNQPSPGLARSLIHEMHENSRKATRQGIPGFIMGDGDGGVMPTKQRRMSWRLGILTKVVTPVQLSKQIAEHDNREDSNQSVQKSPIRTGGAWRALWRKAILETLLLIRMEKENRSLQARQDAVENKRIKLDYQEITPCLKEVTKKWDEMLITPDRASVKFEYQSLVANLKDGVPRRLRGEIWHFLVEQHKLHHPGLNKRNPNDSEEMHLPYEDLLKQLTTHQHAILIDLGRTFPSHPYFATQLGAGQLALFNLLKAYSLLDREVGYCQGLSFVAGTLLMHVPEEKAFETMKYMMFKFGFRRQYRPDMVALQIQMYQLSRLLHDQYRDLYEHFEQNDITPTLYAAPWFLTMFASQFPLGFVARVFDLIFLQGMDVIFKVALVLLGNHKELIKHCDSFESIVEFLKTTLPEMGVIQMERVINQVFAMDISKPLHAYEVEYHVLQEEMISAPPGSENDDIKKLEQANNNLKRQNMDLLEQLQRSHSNNHSLEVQVNNLHGNESKLKSHIRTLEIERAALLNSVDKLRKMIPPETLQEADISIPTIAPAVSLSTSSICNPQVNSLMISSDSRIRSGSLNTLDSEVASYIVEKTKRSRSGENVLRIEIPQQPNRPASTSM